MMCVILVSGTRVSPEAAAGSGQRSEEDHPATQARAGHHRERVPQSQAAAPQR